MAQADVTRDSPNFIILAAYIAFLIILMGTSLLDLRVSIAGNFDTVKGERAAYMIQSCLKAGKGYIDIEALKDVKSVCGFCKICNARAELKDMDKKTLWESEDSATLGYEALVNLKDGFGWLYV